MEIEINDINKNKELLINTIKKIENEKTIKIIKCFVEACFIKSKK